MPIGSDGREIKLTQADLAVLAHAEAEHELTEKELVDVNQMLAERGRQAKQDYAAAEEARADARFKRPVPTGKERLNKERKLTEEQLKQAELRANKARQAELLAQAEVLGTKVAVIAKTEAILGIKQKAQVHATLGKSEAATKATEDFTKRDEERLEKHTAKALDSAEKPRPEETHAERLERIRNDYVAEVQTDFDQTLGSTNPTLSQEARTAARQDVGRTAGQRFELRATRKGYEQNMQSMLQEMRGLTTRAQELESDLGPEASAATSATRPGTR